MASSFISTSHVNKLLNDVLTCGSCPKIAVDPVMLKECKHVYCRDCLKKNENEITCQFCKIKISESVLGQEIDDTPILRDLLHSFKFLAKASKCEFKDCSNSAKNYCKGCQLSYCEKCLSEHNASFFTRNHAVVPLKDNSEDMMKYMVEYCGTHEEEKAQLFCSDCDQLVCITCIHGAHRDHKTEDIKFLAQTSKKEIDTIIKTINTTCSNITKNIKTNKSVENQVMASLADATQSLENRKNEMIMSLNRNNECLSNHLLRFQRASQIAECIKVCTPDHSVVNSLFELQNHLKVSSKFDKNQTIYRFQSFCPEKSVDKFYGYLVKKIEKPLEKIDSLTRMEPIRAYFKTPSYGYHYSRREMVLAVIYHDVELQWFRMVFNGRNPTKSKVYWVNDKMEKIDSFDDEDFISDLMSISDNKLAVIKTDRIPTGVSIYEEGNFKLSNFIETKNAPTAMCTSFSRQIIAVLLDMDRVVFYDQDFKNELSVLFLPSFDPASSKIGLQFDKDDHFFLCQYKKLVIYEKVKFEGKLLFAPVMNFHLNGFADIVLYPPTNEILILDSNTIQSISCLNGEWSMKEVVNEMNNASQICVVSDQVIVYQNDFPEFAKYSINLVKV